MTTAGARAIHEEFARFFEKPTREYLRSVLQTHFGETDQLDFKGEWPQNSKLARHLLGIANSSGGVLIIGVSQQSDSSLNPIGLSSLWDKSDIQKAIQKFLPEKFDYAVLDFSYSASEYSALVGKHFQVVLITDQVKFIPFVAMSDGEGIRRGAIYVRRGTNSEEATYEELQVLLNKRLETQYSSQGEINLEKQLAMLNLLYSYISPVRQRDLKTMLIGPLTFSERNPTFPKEDFDSFLVRMINIKKKQIEDIINGVV